MTAQSGTTSPCVTAEQATLLPCPFCGGADIQVREGTTFRWRVAECGECGAQSGEARFTHGNPDATLAAVATEWNRRTPIQHATPATGEDAVERAAAERALERVIGASGFDCGYPRTIRNNDIATLRAALTAARKPGTILAEVERILGETGGKEFIEAAMVRWQSPPTRQMTAADYALGSWLSAALDDPTCCDEIKAAIREWFAQFEFTLSDQQAGDECNCSPMEAAHGHHFGCPALHSGKAGEESDATR